MNHSDDTAFLRLYVNGREEDNEVKFLFQPYTKKVPNGLSIEM